MRFIIAIDAFRFPGAEIERSLRPYYDIADYEIVPYWERPRSILADRPDDIQTKAQYLLDRLYQDAEAAQYYIGFTRGFYLHQLRVDNRLDIFSACLDFAVVTDRLKQKIQNVCLNPRCIKFRALSKDNALYDNNETLQSLQVLISSFCVDDSVTAKQK